MCLQLGERRRGPPVSWNVRRHNTYRPCASTMKVVRCAHDEHASQILDIFNEAIVTSTALFDYKPRAPESMIPWFKAKESAKFPVIGIESSDGQLLAFASYGTFRAWPAYKYSVEHSVYVHKDHRGKGLGRSLIDARTHLCSARSKLPPSGWRHRGEQLRQHCLARGSWLLICRHHPPSRLQVWALARLELLPTHSANSSQPE